MAEALGMWKFRTIEIHDRELRVTGLFNARLLKSVLSRDEGRPEVK